MAHIVIKGDDFDVTPAIREYIEKRFRKVDRLATSDTPVELFVTTKMTTAHERENTYRVEVKCRLDAVDYFVSVDRDNLMRSVDEAKQELWREITHTKGKQSALVIRGARKIKKLLKGGMDYFRRK